MKLVVFGSTGGIGAQFVTQALAAGHEVTAVARRPSDILVRHERLEVVQGDVLAPEIVRQAVAGKEIVISALGDAQPRADHSLFGRCGEHDRGDAGGSCPPPVLCFRQRT